MPNWCDNNLRVWGDPKALERFIGDIINDDDSIQILKNLLPFPTELEGKDITDEDGNIVGRAFSDEGYNWCLRTWGTKWADCETEIVVREDDNLVLRYQTAWSPAIEGLQRISAMFPTLFFQTDWLEEGMQSLSAASFANGTESVYEVAYDQMPAWSEDDDGNVDWQEYQDAIDELREQAIQQV